MSIYEQAVAAAGQYGLCLVLTEDVPQGTIAVVMFGLSLCDSAGNEMDPAVYIHPWDRER